MNAIHRALKKGWNEVGRKALNVQDARWDRTGKIALDDVREMYESGLVEMAQKREGNEMILLVIPRRQPIQRTGRWFAPRANFKKPK